MVMTRHGQAVKKQILIKKICHIIVFLLILMTGIKLAVVLLYPSDTIIYNWYDFYHTPKQSVDVLIVGNSHAYSSFDTALFEEEEGKNAYILATNSQNVEQSYFNVKESLKYQKPEVIILEASAIDYNDNWRNIGDTYDKSWKKEFNIDGMRFGMVKLEAIRNQYCPENWAYAFFRIAKCHGNWTNINDLYNNIKFYTKDADEFSSFRPSVTSMSKETMEQYAQAERNMDEIFVADANIMYFHKLAELCREEGIELRVIMVPMYDVYIDSINYSSWTDKIHDLTESENVKYLDCNRYYDEIGLTAQDFEDFYSSYHHLNAEGAQKVTDFVLEKFS